MKNGEVQTGLVDLAEGYLSHARENVGQAWIEIQEMELIIGRADWRNLLKSKFEPNPTDE